MANRRMIAKTIIDSDAFLDMPLSTQSLYFHLHMRADDDGFVNSPRKVMRMIGASQDDMKILLVKKFLLAFESGVVVIKHWLIHNYIRKDRYTPTVYEQEKEELYTKDNKSYTFNKPSDSNNNRLGMTSGQPVVNQMDTQVRLGKGRLGKVSKNTVDEKNEDIEEVKPKKKSKVKKFNPREDDYTKEFLDVYDSYPKNGGKRQGMINFYNQLEKHDYQDLKQSVLNYCEAIKIRKTKKRYIVKFSNFFGQKAEFEDYLPNEYQKPDPKDYKETNKSKNGFHNFEGGQKEYTNEELLEQLVKNKS